MSLSTINSSTFFFVKFEEETVSPGRSNEAARTHINDFFDSMTVIALTPEENADFETIPIVSRLVEELGFLPDDFIYELRRQYVKNMCMILNGSLPIETQPNLLSEIQVLLLLRGSAFQADERGKWKIKLQDRLSSIDVMLVLEYI